MINSSHTALWVKEGLPMYATPMYFAAKVFHDRNYPTADHPEAHLKRRRRFRLTRIRARRLPSGASRVAVGNSPC